MEREKLSFGPRCTAERNSDLKALAAAKQRVATYREGKQVYVIANGRGDRAETTQPDRYGVNVIPGQYYYAVKEIRLQQYRNPHNPHE